MRDYDSYYKMMAANIEEKIDFIIDELQHQDYKRVVDFGCADGQVTRALALMFPQIEFIGLDNNKEVIKANTKNNSIENVNYVWSDDINPSDLYTPETMVIFSSVFHEIFSFMAKEKILELLNQISKVKAIAIRDMYFIPNLSEIDKIKEHENLCVNTNKKMYGEFITAKDSIKDSVNDRNSKCNLAKYMTEFFLKSQYIRNWEEELKEDYFATDWEMLDSIFTLDYRYYVGYKHLYMNEYLSSKLPLSSFTNTTHIKLLYKKII